MSTWSARTRLARDRRRPEGFVEPMLATPVQRVPTGPEWQFEVKHDGYRMIARAENGQARMWSRWGPSSCRETHPVHNVGDLRPICCLELPHDVSDVHFHRAFPHIEVKGNDFIGFALEQSVNHGGLARGEQFVPRRLRCGCVFGRASPAR